ncbi:MAG: tRNA pseudouridine(55) synthase TruB [Bacteroidales bacterium]|mgnify:FL=1|jgi:tRNA pseudouridine55 synthase|nr:tRNA pseudouridine(55) synthase TruB [Bacteroidales bacterium]
MGFFILEGCNVENESLAEFFEEHLAISIDEYPEGIVIPIDKPYRWTSADVVRKIKFQIQKHFKQKKIKVGHAGTLDPLATGLLIVCVGKATKLAEILQSHEKEYMATIEFGATTPSFDLEQEIDCYYPFEHITEEMVGKALKEFIGEQFQVPPLFSAKVIDGLRAYEYARVGEEVKLRKSLINITEIELISFDEASAGTPRSETNSREASPSGKHFYQHSSAKSDGTRPSATIRVRCSKGTYIRSLARDLGCALGSGGYLIALRRTASGFFSLNN